MLIALFCSKRYQNTVICTKGLTREGTWTQFTWCRMTMGVPNHCGGCQVTVGWPKSLNNVTSTFSNKVNLIPEDLRFEHGGARHASYPVPLPRGGHWWAYPPNKAPSPPSNWNMQHYKTVEFWQFLECQTPPRKRKPPTQKRKTPLLKTFWGQFCSYPGRHLTSLPPDWHENCIRFTYFSLKWVIKKINVLLLIFFCHTRI